MGYEADGCDDKCKVVFEETYLEWKKKYTNHAKLMQTPSNAEKLKQFMKTSSKTVVLPTTLDLPKTEPLLMKHKKKRLKLLSPSLSLLGEKITSQLLVPAEECAQKLNHVI